MAAWRIAASMACCAAWSLVVSSSAYPCPPVLWRRTRSTVLTIELLREYDDGSSCMLAKIEPGGRRASVTHILGQCTFPRSQGAEGYSDTVSRQPRGPRGVSAVQFVAVQFVAKRARLHKTGR